MLYFSRIIATNKYHFSALAKDDDEIQRLEDIIKAIDKQLVV